MNNHKGLTRKATRWWYCSYFHSSETELPLSFKVKDDLLKTILTELLFTLYDNKTTMIAPDLI